MYPRADPPKVPTFEQLPVTQRQQQLSAQYGFDFVSLCGSLSLTRLVVATNVARLYLEQHSVGARSGGRELEPTKEAEL